MNLSEIVEAFDAVQHEAGQFERIKDRIVNHANLCGLNYLYNLQHKHDLLDILPAGDLLLRSVLDGRAALNVNMKELAKVITVKDIIYLTRCGILCSVVADGRTSDAYLYLQDDDSLLLQNHVELHKILDEEPEEDGWA